MSIKLRCMCCKLTRVFTDLCAAREEQWHFTDAEIAGNYTPIVLCPECNSGYMYTQLVREKLQRLAVNG